MNSAWKNQIDGLFLSEPGLFFVMYQRFKYTLQKTRDVQNVHKY